MGYSAIQGIKRAMINSRHSFEQGQLTVLLKRLRIEAGLTQIQLAHRLSSPQSFVSKYETGERALTVPELRIVCISIGISFPEFATLYEELVTKCKQTKNS